MGHSLSKTELSKPFWSGYFCGFEYFEALFSLSKIDLIFWAYFNPISIILHNKIDIFGGDLTNVSAKRKQCLEAVRYLGMSRRRSVHTRAHKATYLMCWTARSRCGTEPWLHTILSQAPITPTQRRYLHASLSISACVLDEISVTALQKTYLFILSKKCIFSIKVTNNDCFFENKALLSVVSECIFLFQLRFHKTTSPLECVC